MLKDLQIDRVTCLVSTDDESFTYNRQVNRLATVLEHKMILKLIERGVPEDRIRYAPPATQLGRETLNALTFELDKSTGAGQPLPASIAVSMHAAKPGCGPRCGKGDISRKARRLERWLPD